MKLWATNTISLDLLSVKVAIFLFDQQQLPKEGIVNLSDIYGYRSNSVLPAQLPPEKYDNKNK